MSHIQDLEKQLRKASDAYYNDENVMLSDKDFDNLRDELQKLDPDNAFLKEVGAFSTTALSKVKHVIPMGSLDKINTEKEFNTWLTTLSKTVTNEFDRDILIEDKLDGVSLEIVFYKGKFVQAITRGDGQIGDDVTHTIKNAKGFPRKIDTDNEYVYVRCEAVLLLDVWKKHFSDTTANPRNAVAGLVRRTSAVDSEHITCIAFDVEWSDDEVLAEYKKIEWLREQDFNVVETEVVFGRELSNLPQMFDQMLKRRDTLNWEVDGTVLKINNLSQQRKLGERDGRPKWAKAWKFPASGGHTTLIGVEWSVGTQGTITPVAKVKPVSVGGTTIQNITLHNADEIERLGIYIGDTIEVIRSGDVIPAIVRVVTPGKKRVKIEITECPSCGTSVERDGPRVICPNNNCKGSASKRIKKWISKRNIMFLGDSALNTLECTGVVNSIASLYIMTQEKMVAAGLGGRMSEKILEEIKKSQNVELSDFLGSLSIDMLGRREAANLVTAGFDSLDKWENMTVDDLLKLDGFKETKATRICEGVQYKWNEIQKLSMCLNITNPKKKEKKMSSSLESVTFCFTGKMEHPRKELEGLVESNGGRVTSVNKNLTYLVIADVNSTSSKAVKARKLGTTLISEDDFLDMIG
ncbi:hypothetical protein LCGC14_1511790 [marine sediment metagenome]|uniref:DNA ligase (NAD(+)) n=1 Tax=marine sediment metagenome TaxID=412755 RepID=A0A0F9M2C2_9ZZZZ